MKQKQSYTLVLLLDGQTYDLREGPDAMSDVELRGWRTGMTVDELTDLLLLCPDHGAHTFKTSCGVTRCQHCGKVAA